MTTVEALLHRARVMRRVRLVIAVLVPIEMLLYVSPPGVPSRLAAIPASIGVVLALAGISAASAVAARRADEAGLVRMARAELVVDALICLGILQVFAFDQYSAMWAILLVALLEGAFREGLRGATLMWAGTGIAYAAIQVGAGLRYPDTAPLDPGSILFRALITGVVAVVAGSLASQLESAVRRHQASEAALAEQYADLRRIGRVSRAIAAGPEARREVCRAVAELTGAAVVVLYEPGEDDARLHCTAADGCGNALMPPLTLDDENSGTVRAFLSGRLQLVVDADPPAAFGHVPLAHRAASAVFVPVLRDGRSVATMTVMFAERTESLTPRVAAAIEVLAEEAAVAIVRADLTAHLASEARRDQLTGLVNRRGMEEALATEMQRARRTNAPLTVLMLDLDGLKVFNDAYGHLAGDRLIAGAASGWKSRLRPTDVLARYGGDEFVAVLPGCDEARALRVADGLLAAMPPGGSCSVGAASWDHREEAAQLLSRADSALYSGKRAGGGRAVPALAAVPAPRKAAGRSGARTA